MAQFIMALDQGTTSSRAIIFDRAGCIIASDQREFEQILPSAGHVEHDPEEIWRTQLAVARGAIAAAGISASEIAAIGITNQRETTILWDAATGDSIGNAIVWQSRITTPICEELKEAGHESQFRKTTGLVLDPYFSGTKIRYMLDQDSELSGRAQRGEILFGTVDSFLVWRLTGGKCHVTDASNASRTLLFNLHEMAWDESLAKLLDVPMNMLPTVVDSSGVIGMTDPEWFGVAIPIAGIAGDQQAATFGQACFEPGNVKSTYGTGCFLLMNTGSEPVESQNQLLTTVGWSIGGETVYCLEGSVFIGGAVVQWLRDGLGMISDSSEVEALAASVEDHGGVYLVPAFVGLGAPHWDPTASGTMIGLSRGSTAGHVARAALESMAFQTADVVAAMQRDSGLDINALKVDGGASVNNMLMQFQSDLLQVVVERPRVAETTALGAAYLAGLAVDYWNDQSDVLANWQLGQSYRPSMAESETKERVAQWRRAVQRSLQWNV
ncbi:MAG: glycerol kinase [Rhodopirellula sp.]|nr:glycerol kinase [Rhodopirellula sp.]MBE73906.1 glycerol kinase [Rhodopirellula sp.]